MKKILPAAPALLLALCALLPACSDDTNSTETSGECIVKQVTLGSLKRYLTTTSSTGADSTYRVTVTGSLYPMTIDQTGLRIFNADSLPYGTDVTRVPFSVFSASATLSIRSLYSGQDTTFVYSDSTDFSRPRLVTAYATDGTSRKTYTVEVRCHKEAGDSSTWTQRARGVAALAGLTLQRAYYVDGTLYAFARRGAQPVALTASAADVTTWTEHDITPTTVDVSTIVERDGTFYALSDGRLALSGDGAGWTTDATTLPDGVQAFTALVTAGTTHVAALAGTQLYSTTDRGQTWTADAMDTADAVPTEAFAGLTIPSATDATYEDLMLLGTKDGEARVWKRPIDLTGAATYPWTYYPASTAANNCPALSAPQLLRYDGAALLTGLNAAGAADSLYMSYDNGRAWFTGYLRRPGLPDGVTSLAACTDGTHVLLLCGGTGDVWAGRINRVAWTKEETSFE